MKSTPFILLFSAAGFLQACTTKEVNNEPVAKKSDEIPVRVLTLVKQEVRPVIETSGLFTTDDETMLSFKTGGVIERIFVKEGDAIKKGQILATLHLTEIEAQVAQAKLAFEKAKRDYKRVQNLYKDSVATLEQFQNAKTGYEVSQQQLEAANFNRSFSEIRAINSGFVLRKMVNEGQVVGPGSGVLQTNGASMGNWKLRVGVSDREWAVVSLQDKATVTTDALGDKKLLALVTRKSEGTDGTSGAFTLELTLQESSASLASGLFGKASIQANHTSHVWSIPYDALLDGDARSGYVFTTNDSKTAVKTRVTISSITRQHVLVTSGLENSTALIVSGNAYLRDGSKISVLK
jgi:RND family efflux transporter MFP subunit